jgi:hypothetical protein
MTKQKNKIGPKTTGSRWADDRIGRALNRTQEEALATALRVLTKLTAGAYAPKLVWERVACDNALDVLGMSGKGDR